MKYQALFFFCISVPAQLLYAGPDYLIQRTVIEKGDAHGPVYEGDVRLLKRPVHPASVFKVVILAALLRHGAVDPHAKVSVEKRIATGPVPIRVATFHSSNQAFADLARSLPVGSLRKEAEASRFFREVLPLQFGSQRSIFRGADVLTDPERLHLYITQVAGGTGLDSTRREHLNSFLTWPGRCEAGIRDQAEQGTLHAKSGAWGGSAWMTGYCIGSSITEVVTVYIPYTAPHWKPARERGIHYFYKAFRSVPPAEVFH